MFLATEEHFPQLKLLILLEQSVSERPETLRISLLTEANMEAGNDIPAWLVEIITLADFNNYWVSPTLKDAKSIS